MEATHKLSKLLTTAPSSLAFIASLKGERVRGRGTEGESESEKGTEGEGERDRGRG